MDPLSMSDAANPYGEPADHADAQVDSIVASILGSDDTDADAAAEPQQPTSEAQPEEPDAGDEAEAPEPDDAPQEPPTATIRVKVRGEWRDVPLEEAAAGYSRTEDYRAKTAELAEQRRALERQQAEFTTRMQAIDALLANAPMDPVLADGDKTDWQKLAQEDPAGYVARRAAYESRLQAYQQAIAYQQHAQAEEAKRRLEAAQAALEAEIPEWSDKDKRNALVRDVSDALSSYGFTRDEMNGITDHRVIKVALDAARWRKAQAARAKAEKAPAAAAQAPAPKVMRPGGGDTARPSDVTQRKRLDAAIRSGNTDAIVDAFLKTF